MRSIVAMLSAVVLSAFAAGALRAQDYLTKEGHLTQPLKVVLLQSGFAGVTGTQYTIAPDGAWTIEGVFNAKKSAKGKGKLSAKDLAKLAAILKKFDLDGLPAKTGTPPGANPNTTVLTYGKKSASLVGRTPPALDSKNPTGTVASRFAGIRDGAVALVAPPTAPKKGGKVDAVKKDRKQIAGTWRVTAFEVGGNKAQEADARKLSVVNRADGTWTLLSDGVEIGQGTSTIDPKQKPKTIDFTQTEGEGKGKRFVGIYELSGKTRRLCFVPVGRDRPTEFASESGSEAILVTFEREE